MALKSEERLIIGYKSVIISFIVLFFGVGVFLNKAPYVAKMIGGYCITALLLFFGVWLIRRANRSLIENLNTSILLVLLLLVYSSRLLYSFFAATRVAQISDFQIAIEGVASGVFTDKGFYYVMSPYKMVYPFLLHKLGFTGAQLPIFILHSFFSVLTAYGIFLLGAKVADRDVGYIAVFIYLIWPSSLFYLSVFTEEHLAATVTVYLVYFIIRLIECLCDSSNQKLFIMKRCILYSSIICVLCGIDVILKDWGLIAIVAFLVVLPIIIHKNHKSILFILMVLIIIVGGRALIQKTELQFVSKYTNGMPPDNGIYLHMYISLIPEGTVSHNYDKTEEYMQMYIDSNYDLNSLHKDVRHEVLRRFIDNPKGFIDLLMKKVNRSYLVGDWETNEWAFLEYPSKWQEEHEGFISFIQNYNYLFYLGLVILLIQGFFSIHDISGLYIGLIIVGAMSSQLLIEAQGRYKYSIEPLWCVIAAMGFLQVSVCTNNIYKKLMRRP